jgi:DNA processing protein
MSKQTTPVVEMIAAAGRTEHSLDTVARVAWATVAPPGDELVGALIADVGAATALEAVFGDDEGPVADLTARRVRRRCRTLIPGSAAYALRVGDRQGLRVLSPLEREWPRRLDALGTAAPPVLWVRGDATMLARPSIAVIGDRRLSPFGLHATLELASQLAVAGFAIATAATAGVDTAALLATVAVGRIPVAVLATGIDEGSLGEEHRLIDRVEAAGVVVSDVPPGAPPDGAAGARRARPDHRRRGCCPLRGGRNRQACARPRQVGRGGAGTGGPDDQCRLRTAAGV